MNSGGIRADINAGEITYGEAFSVQPFANVLVTMDMTGAQIDALLEQQFHGRQRDAPDLRFPDLRPIERPPRRATASRTSGSPAFPSSPTRPIG